MKKKQDNTQEDHLRKVDAEDIRSITASKLREKTAADLQKEYPIPHEDHHK